MSMVLENEVLYLKNMKLWLQDLMCRGIMAETDEHKWLHL
jgi:hypothetical protein